MWPLVACLFIDPYVPKAARSKDRRSDVPGFEGRGTTRKKKEEDKTRQVHSLFSFRARSKLCGHTETGFLLSRFLILIPFEARRRTLETRAVGIEVNRF